MRQVLVDFARARLAQRRGFGDASESLNGTASASLSGSADIERVLQIGVLMDRLEKADLAAARIVDMHYFAGFTLEEIAGITGLSLRQIRYRWTKGRDWLKDRLA